MEKATVWFIIVMVICGLFAEIILLTSERPGLVETTCRLIDLVETNTEMNCTVTTHTTGTFYGYKIDEKHEKVIRIYRCLVATVSLDYHDNTCRKARLFRSVKDAEKTKYKYSAYECKQPWDITSFVTGLENNGQLRCAYHPRNPRRAYVVDHSYLPYLVPIAVIIIIIMVKGQRFVQSLKETIVGLLAPMKEPMKTLFVYLKGPTTEEAKWYLFKNNLKIVKRYFTPNNVNTEIWWQDSSISPLSIATLLGHVEIMDYFCTIGADLSSEDNANAVLHFACLGGSTEAIEWCLAKKLPVDGISSRSQTPLQTYLLTTEDPSVDLIQRFVEAGADLKIVDAFHCSVLHHACLNKTWGKTVKRQIIKFLIKAGCVSHQCVALLNVSPMLLLLLQEEYELCDLLIEAGYQIKKDSNLPIISQLLNDVPEERRSGLANELLSVPPLKRLCRTVVRNVLGCRKTQADLELPIPNSLKEFVKLEGH